MDKSGHDKIAVAVDFLLFTIEDDRLKILMVRREQEPFQGLLALPGVAVAQEETLAHAARRCLEEETGITEPIYLEQLYTWGDDCRRDPRGRVISVSYMALIPREKLTEKSGKRVTEVFFAEVDQLLAPESQLSFDHKEIIAYGRERIRNKTAYTDIAFHILPEEFTLPQLQKVYEILLGKELYKANFRKSIQDMVADTGKLRKEGAHRPSKVYVRKSSLKKQMIEREEIVL